MLTTVSIWILYTASYLPIYIFFLFRLLSFKQCTFSIECLLYPWNLHPIIFSILIFLTVFSITVFFIIVYRKSFLFSPSERIYGKLSKNTTSEMTAFFIPYILSILSINFDYSGAAIFIIIFLLCGIIILQTDWLRLCPIFFYAGYKLYIDENETYILSRLKIEQFNQILMDETNGIEATPLSPNLYIVTRKNF